MIPVSSLEDVRINRLKIRKHGFALHGFLLYTSSDKFITEYIDDEGLTDLDMWSGDECGLFLLYDPPSDWVSYAKSQNHIWWETFGSSTKTAHLAREYADAAVLDIGEGTPVSFKEILPLPGNRGLAKQHVASILSFFEIDPTKHPSIILFRDLQDRDVWLVELDDFLGLDPLALRRAFKSWFSSDDFKKLLKR